MTRRPRRALRALLAVAFALTGAGLLTASPALPASSASAAPAARLDLVLLLDGSGSIDDADWDLQLQGYAAALRDRTNFPVDGSVAVSVIQWSYRSRTAENVRVEVPLTVLDSAATVDDVAAQVLAISQIGWNTNPGDAVVAAAQELAAHGRSGATGALCMSTDGSSNDGVGLSSATVTARERGVDRFSVVAIEDGSFTEAKARSAYGPHVFGGGQVTVARTTAEFTTMIAGCAADPLQLVALEVTQGLQDLDNTVPVVETRDTLVRAYLATTDNSTVRATARLHVTRDGAPIPGSPFTPTSAYSPVPVPGVLVDGDALGDRSSLDKTLNFRIPSEQAHGTWNVRLEYAGGLTCTREAANPTCSEQVTFRRGAEMHLVTVAMGTWDDGAWQEPSQADLAEQAARVGSMLPLSALEVEQHWMGVGDSPSNTLDFLWLDLRLRAKRALDTPARLFSEQVSEVDPSEIRYYGVIPGAPPAGANLSGLASGPVAAGYDGGSTGMLDAGFYRNTGPHELMHTYGGHHSVNAAANGYDTLLGGMVRHKRGWCGEVADEDAPEWPYTGTNAKGTFAAVGPLESGRRAEVWGVEVRLSALRTPLALVDPHATPSLMSYCSSVDKTIQRTWIGAPDWDFLLSQFPAAAPTPVPDPSPRPAPSPRAGTLVRAMIDTDGVVTMLPALPLDQDPTPDDPAGTHAIVMLDAAGVPVHTVRFTPEGANADAVDGSPVGTPGSAVSVVVPDATDAATIELRSGEQVLATVPVSENAPQVSVDVPTTGDQDRVTFTWSAQDADGDPIAHAVRYSADDGESWTTVGVDLDETSISVPRWALAGSDAARIQVIASDGMNTAVTTSDAFAMPNLAPEVAVTSPAEGTVVSGAQTVVFTGSAFDAEDGDLSGELVWTSDLDGQLGTGGTVTRRADELSEGVHVISATATDAAGVTSTASVGLTVHRIAPDVAEPGPGDGPGADPTPGPSQPPAPSDGARAPAAGAPAAPGARAGGPGGMAASGWTVLPWVVAAGGAIALGALLLRGRSRLASGGRHGR